MNNIEVYKLTLEKTIIDEDGETIKESEPIVLKADNLIPYISTVYPKPVESIEIVKDLCDNLINNYEKIQDYDYKIKALKESIESDKNIFTEEEDRSW